jgi:hypothetical protein
MLDGEQKTSDIPAAETAAEESEKSTEASDRATENGAKPSLEQMQGELDALRKANESLQIRLLDPEYQEHLARKRSGNSEEAVEEEAPAAKPADILADLTEEKLSAMSNRELLETAIEKAVALTSRQFQKHVIPKIEERLSHLGATVADEQARRDVAQTAVKYKDFWDYQKDMIVLSSDPKFRDLNAEDCYLLAKARRSGGKTDSNLVTQARSAKAISEKPTTGSGGAGTSSKKGEMTADEAAQDAWEKVFGSKK